MTAGYITELLRRSAVCGVAWGETVASIVSGLGALRIRPPWKEQPITFIPLCGEPPGRALGEYSASAAAAQLDKIVNNDETSHSPSLAGVFALIPREFDWKAVQIIRKAFGYLDGYRDIFQRERWIDKIDCVLTSVSADESPLTFGLLDLTRATGGPDRKRLHELVIGDICGIFIPRLGLRSPELAELKEIQKRWNGMTELQLKRCADNALQNGAPGVIVMAIGKNKAAMVYESVKRGLVNTLVIDDDLAEELKHLIAM